MSLSRRIAVIGLGYVGLPVAAAFAAADERTIGFDIDTTRIDDLRRGIDRNGQVDVTVLAPLAATFASDPNVLRSADFFIVAVPTPVDGARAPDLRHVIGASRIVGAALRPGGIVVYESTVYPGATEEVCVPVLEEVSGLRCGRDFFVGYSPERINPGDDEHGFARITKVVAGMDGETARIIADVYGAVVSAGIHVAPSIRVAEAAKVIENAQRDVNIAFMNELAKIFHRLNLDTGDVLAAAATKWNFLPFTPGLVGGHCIGVDPYYLSHRAQMAGYHPEIILAGRRVNDGMADYIAAQCLKLMHRHLGAAGPVLQLGLTFKENVADLRNSKAADIALALREFGLAVAIADPLADPGEAEHEYGLGLVDLADAPQANAVILAVAHRAFTALSWPDITARLRNGRGVVLDVKRVLDRDTVPDGIVLWRL